MNSETKRDIKLGLFVVLGIIIFIFGIFLVGAKSGLFSKSFTIYAVFKNTSGLKPGGNIRFDGVKVGIVKNVNIINDSSVRVDMNIDESKHEFITKGAVASISSDGLMGDEIVTITSGVPGSPMAENGDEIKTRQAMNIEKVMASFGGTADNINGITQNLKSLTDNLNTKNGTIQSVLKDTEMVISLRQTVSNLQTMSNIYMQEGNDLRKVTSDLTHGNGVVANLINDPKLKNNLTETVSKLKETSDKLGAVADQAAVTMQHVNSGNGTVNTLLTDTAMANNLKMSASNIKTATVALNEDLVAIQHNFLFRGYFKKKAKDK